MYESFTENRTELSWTTLHLEKKFLGGHLWLTLYIQYMQNLYKYTQVPQIRPPADTVHFKGFYLLTGYSYLLTYIDIEEEEEEEEEIYLAQMTTISGMPMSFDIKR